MRAYRSSSLTSTDHLTHMYHTQWTHASIVSIIYNMTHDSRNENTTTVQRTLCWISLHILVLQCWARSHVEPVTPSRDVKYIRRSATEGDHSSIGGSKPKTILFRILGMSTLASLHNCIHHDFTIKVFLTYAQYMYNHEAPLLFPSQRKHMMRTLRHDPDNSTFLRFDPGIFVANRATSRNHSYVKDGVNSSAIIEDISCARTPKHED